MARLKCTSESRTQRAAKRKSAQGAEGTGHRNENRKGNGIEGRLDKGKKARHGTQQVIFPWEGYILLPIVRA